MDQMEEAFDDIAEELKSRGSDREDPAIENTRHALDELGRPDGDLKVVLVGGTNGKGSTVEMISELLQSQGFEVGVAKSPHLVTLRERIKFNSQKISEKEFTELYRKIGESGDQLSFFEFMIVSAYMYFSEKDVECAVMEVGMGGRLDATNAADPELSVITNIQKDHMEYLGDTREQIAKEKAGIIPENGKIVSDVDTEVIEEVADERNSRVIRTIDLRRKDEGFKLGEKRFDPPVDSEFQKENLENALTAVRELEKLPEDLEDAFSDLECPARMEVVSREPLYIQDGAHNPAAIDKVIEDLPKDFICLFNCTKLEKAEKMVEKLEQKASKFYITESNVPWCESPQKLQEAVSEDYCMIEDAEEAERQALEEASSEDMPLVAIGSLYLIGALRDREEG